MNRFWEFRRLLAFSVWLMIALVPVKVVRLIVQPALMFESLERMESYALHQTVWVLLMLTGMVAILGSAVISLLFLAKLPAILERIPFFRNTLLWNPATQPAPAMSSGRKRMTLDPLVRHLGGMIVLMSVAMGCFAVGHFSDPRQVWLVRLGSLLMFGLGMVGVFGGRRWAVEYDDFGLKWMSEFGRLTVFAWEDILSVEYRQDWKLKLTRGRKVSLTGYAVGAQEFLWKLQARTGLKVPNLFPAFRT
jgi:hypothetical protein